MILTSPDAIFRVYTLFSVTENLSCRSCAVICCLQIELNCFGRYYLYYRVTLTGDFRRLLSVRAFSLCDSNQCEVSYK